MMKRTLAPTGEINSWKMRYRLMNSRELNFKKLSSIFQPNLFFLFSLQQTLLWLYNVADYPKLPAFVTRFSIDGCFTVSSFTAESFNKFLSALILWVFHGVRLASTLCSLATGDHVVATRQEPTTNQQTTPS